MKSPSFWRRVLDALPGDYDDEIILRVNLAFLYWVLTPLSFLAMAVFAVWGIIAVIRGES